MSCEHHRNCGDCFGPQVVSTLESKLKKLATDLVEATEWNLATLEELLCRKGSSKASVSRQRSICLKMLLNCVPLKDSIDWSQGMWDDRLTKFSRTKRVLEASNVEQGLDALIESCK